MDNIRREIGLMGVVQPLMQVVGVAVSIILARFLTPGDYGLVGMATAFTGVLAMVSKLGISDAALQRHELTCREASALFWLNAFAGFILGGFAVAVGPAIAAYFGEPAVAVVAAWAGLALMLNVTAEQHRVQVMRRGGYGTLAVVDLVTQVAAGTCAVMLALLGWGWKALVGLFVLQAVFRLGGSVSAARWRPQTPRVVDLPLDTVKLGLAVCAGWILTSLQRAAEGAVIGKLGGANGLGLYTKGQQLARYPLMVFFVPAFLPSVHRLSRLVESDTPLEAEYSRLLWWVLLLASAPLGVLAGTADELIPFVLGEQWAAAVPVTVAFVVVSFAHPVVESAMWVLTASDDKRGLLGLRITIALATVCALWFGMVLGGVLGAAMAVGAAMWIVLVPASFLFTRGRVRLVFASVLRPVAATVGAGGAAAATAHLLLNIASQWGIMGMGSRLGLASLGASVTWFAAARLGSPRVFGDVVLTVLTALRLAEFGWARRVVKWCGAR